jgi:hypothetical protein
VQDTVMAIVKHKLRLNGTNGEGAVVTYSLASGRGGLVRSPHYNPQDYTGDVFQASAFVMEPDGGLGVHEPMRTAKDERALEAKRCIWCGNYGRKQCALRQGADPYCAEGHPVRPRARDMIVAHFQQRGNPNVDRWLKTFDENPERERQLDELLASENGSELLMEFIDTIAPREA